MSFTRSRIAVFTLLCTLAPALHAATGKKVHLQGRLIDLVCWNERQGDAEKLVKEHTKSCLQMPVCIKGGYAVVTEDGKVYKMDAASNTAATKWIAATNREDNWLVNVDGRVQTDKDGDILSVSKIKLAN